MGRTGLLLLLAAAALAGAACAEGDWPQPDPSTLPEGDAKDEVLYGQRLITETYSLIGPEVANPAMRYAGDNLACGSCHLKGGAQRFGLSFIGVYGAYPANMARENEMRTLEQRINGCMERSMNGRVLPEDGKEMKAMLAYLRFMSAEALAKKEIAGRGSPPLKFLDRAADPSRGAAIYGQICVQCHGADGQGQRRGVKGDAKGYLYPPLWGPDSFNDGAGMHRLITAARFIHANMPFGTTYEAPVLSREDAWDVAAYINSRPRPHKEGLDRDYPDRARKPVDAPFPPYADDFPLEQHRLGPFQSILDARRDAGDGR